MTDANFSRCMSPGDPEAVAPHTTMRNVSVKDPATRAAIVEYLRTLRE